MPLLQHMGGVLGEQGAVLSEVGLEGSHLFTRTHTRVHTHAHTDTHAHAHRCKTRNFSTLLKPSWPSLCSPYVCMRPSLIPST
jgi:hypothetical protein